MKFTAKRSLFGYLVLSLAVFFLVLYFYNISNDYLNFTKSPFIGNNESVIRLLNGVNGEDKKDEFSFAFISDTENNDRSLWLIRTLLAEDIDFLVFVSDAANDPWVSEHRLFYNTVKKYNPGVPVFLVAGNHDVDIKKIGAGGQRFGKQDFYDLYGPINFKFEYQDCLFVFVSNIDQKDPEAAAFLEQALAERGDDIRITFLFTPSPLRMVLNRWHSHHPSWEVELDRIVKEYGVDYVISADLHRRMDWTDNNGIQHIMTGSGGAHLKGKKDKLFGEFRCGTRVTVYPELVLREIVINRNTVVFTDNSIRRFYYAKFMPYFEGRIYLLYAIFAAVILNLLFSLYAFIKKIDI